jgi:hypothetical protein
MRRCHLMVGLLWGGVFSFVMGQENYLQQLETPFFETISPDMRTEKEMPVDELLSSIGLIKEGCKLDLNVHVLKSILTAMLEQCPEKYNELIKADICRARYYKEGNKEQDQQLFTLYAIIKYQASELKKHAMCKKIVEKFKKQHPMNVCARVGSLIFFLWAIVATSYLAVS